MLLRKNVQPRDDVFFFAMNQAYERCAGISYIHYHFHYLINQMVLSLARNEVM